MGSLEGMSWQDKLDRLELLADPELMPLVISIRADMELFVGAALDARKAIETARAELQAILRERTPA